MTLCALIGIWCAVLSGPAVPIDGDTLIIRGTHIRLAGIDAEELHEMHGYEAKNALAELVRDQIVTCEDTGQRSYNRIVAKCYAGLRRSGNPNIKLGMDIGWAMVRKGYALDCARYSHGEYLPAEPVGARVRLKQKPYC